MSEARVTFNLNKVVSILNDHADGILRARFDMTYSQFVFLLSLQDEACSVTDAARRQGVSVAAVSKRVPWFTERGLVRVSADDSNARRVMLTLSPKARRLVVRASDALEMSFRELFVELDDVDLDELNRMLRSITSRLEDKPKETK